MKYEEYQGLINNIVQTPDEAPILAQKALEAIKADTDTLDSQSAKISELEGKIKDLQNTNIKLFLQQTGQAPKDETEQVIDPHELAKQIMEGK